MSSGSRKLVGRLKKIGVAWYRKEQWERLLDISEDRDELEETYEEWLASATDSLRQVQEKGLDLEKVDVDVEELLAWCKAEGLRVNGENRTFFVAEKIRRKYQEIPEN